MFPRYLEEIGGDFSLNGGPRPTAKEMGQLRGLLRTYEVQLQVVFRAPLRRALGPVPTNWALCGPPFENSQSAQKLLRT